jgi:hypothetical protein
MTMLFTVEVLAIHVTAEIVYLLKFSIASTDWCYEFAFYSIQYLFLLWLEAKFVPFCRPLPTSRRLVETRCSALVGTGPIWILHCTHTM